MSDIMIFMWVIVIVGVLVSFVIFIDNEKMRRDIERNPLPPPQEKTWDLTDSESS